jgi:multiple sugar transport system substrate-binding protein
MLTKDHAKQQAAWELMKWLTNNASETAISENIGYPPLRPTLANDPKYLQSWAHAQALLPANLAQIQQIVPWQAYPGPNFLQIENLLATASSTVVFQKADPQKTMADAQSQAHGLIR